MLATVLEDYQRISPFGPTERNHHSTEPALINIVLADGTELIDIDVEADRVLAAVQVAKGAYELVARGTQMLGQSLCSDPGLNIVLDLFLSTVVGKPLSVTSVCIGSRSAMATALRYISLLRDAGYVSRVADGKDGRRYHIVFTRQGWSKTLDILAPVVDCGTKSRHTGMPYSIDRHGVR